jgi:2-dehydro-3-deoxygalactonokinase
MAAALLACDWGSTNLRAWVLDADGAVLEGRDFPLGVNRLKPGEAERHFLADVRPALGADHLPALLCGAVGSNVGWTTVPYADCPATLAEVAKGLGQAVDRVWIAPGLRCAGLDGACDVLRGEETQAFGWVGLAPERASGRHLACLPGTHAKWLVIEDGRVSRFLSAFTGEMFAVLSAHSLLRNDGRANDAEAFEEGLAAAGEGDALLNRIYTARTRVAGAGADNATTGSYLSGLLIGAEVAATPRLLGLEGEPVALVGEPGLCARYAHALARRGVATTISEGDAAVRAGLFAVARMGGLI